jgi:hypothetical protein
MLNEVCRREGHRHFVERMVQRRQCQGTGVLNLKDKHQFNIAAALVGISTLRPI